jgi:hypothetical protein
MTNTLRRDRRFPETFSDQLTLETVQVDKTTLLDLHEWALANQFEAGVCRAVSHAWREEATKRPFNLRAPRVHVRHILEACDSAGDSWTKAAKIFIAAAPAVDLRVPESITVRVRRLAGEPQPDG